MGIPKAIGDCPINDLKTKAEYHRSRPRSRDETIAHLQSISFTAKPLLYTVKLFPEAFYLVILEYEVPNTTVHIRRSALQDCKFSTLAVDFE